MPQPHHPDPSNIQPVALRRVRVEELDEVEATGIDRSAEVEQALWDERNDGDRFE